MSVTEPQRAEVKKPEGRRPRRDGDDGSSTATKVLSHNGGLADVHVVVATVDSRDRNARPGLVVVARALPGRPGERRRPRWIRASPRRVVLEDCGSRPTNLLGGEEKLERSSKARRRRQEIPGADAWRPRGDAAAGRRPRLSAFAQALQKVEPRVPRRRPKAAAAAAPSAIQQTLGRRRHRDRSGRRCPSGRMDGAQTAVPMTGARAPMVEAQGRRRRVWRRTTLMDLVGPDRMNTDYQLGSSSASQITALEARTRYSGW